MPCLFGKYKDIFGKPGTGIHSTRVFNIAIADVISTFIGAVFLWWAMSYKYSLLLIFAFLIILGIILHRLFCVNTTINKLIFGVVS